MDLVFEYDRQFCSSSDANLANNRPLFADHHSPDLHIQYPHLATRWSTLGSLYHCYVLEGTIFRRDFPTRAITLTARNTKNESSSASSGSGIPILHTWEEEDVFHSEFVNLLIIWTYNHCAAQGDSKSCHEKHSAWTLVI